METHAITPEEAALVEQCREAITQPFGSLIEPDTFSVKARQFLVALAALCTAHEVMLGVSGYESLQIWDLETQTGEPWHCNGIEDRTGDKG